MCLASIVTPFSSSLWSVLCKRSLASRGECYRWDKLYKLLHVQLLQASWMRTHTRCGPEIGCMNLQWRSVRLTATSSQCFCLFFFLSFSLSFFSSLFHSCFSFIVSFLFCGGWETVGIFLSTCLTKYTCGSDDFDTIIVMAPNSLRP